jgi:hypothetical protein
MRIDTPVMNLPVLDGDPRREFNPPSTASPIQDLVATTVFAAFAIITGGDTMNEVRRRFLQAWTGAAATATLSGCGFSLEHGLLNPCRAALPPHLAEHEAVAAA